MMNIKSGGIITIENEKFLILEIIKIEDKQYLYCSTTKKGNITVAVFEYKVNDDNIYTKLVTDDELIMKMSQKIYSEKKEKMEEEN